jgi:hypothetical protein
MLGFPSIFIGRFVPLIGAIAIYGLGCRGFRQPEIFLGAAAQDGSKKYERSSLSDNESRQKLSVLLDYMEKDKPYTDWWISMIAQHMYFA